MSIIVNLPPHLEKELMIDARREGIAPAEQVAFFLCLASALQVEGLETPFGAALRSFLSRHQIDPDHLASTLDQLKDVCFKTTSPAFPDVDSEESSDRVRLDGFLRLWRDDSVHQSVGGVGAPPADTSSRHTRDRPQRSILGKYAHLGVSSEVHAREKQEELDREDRKSWE